MPPLVVVPGVRDELLDLLRDRAGPPRGSCERSRLRMTPRGIRKLFGSFIAVRREVAVAQEVAEPFTLRRPVLVEAGDRQRVRHVDLVDELAHARDDVLHLRQPLGVDRRVRVEVDRVRHAADHEVRVRVLAAEDRVQLRDVALPGERVEVVRDRHQVRLRRQLVGRVTPVAVGEDAELARLRRSPSLASARRRSSRARNAGSCESDCASVRGRRGIGLQRGDHVHPVERVQVVEVHDVVVHVLRADHQVADEVARSAGSRIAARPRPRAPRRCRAPACRRRRCAARRPRRRAGRGRAG